MKPVIPPQLYVDQKGDMTFLVDGDGKVCALIPLGTNFHRQDALALAREIARRFNAPNPAL